MWVQWMGVAGIAAVAAVAGTLGRPLWIRGATTLGSASVALLLCWALSPTVVEAPQPVTPTSVRAGAPSETWASSRACRACHPGQYDSWYASYHRTMTQEASAESIVAPWTGTLSKDGRSYGLSQEGGQFLVDVPKLGTTGNNPADRETLPVVMVTGSHHLQLYWVPLPWADAEPSPKAKASFEQECGECHGGAAPTVDLRERGLAPPAVALAMESPAHAGVQIARTQRAAIVRYVQRIQVRGRLQQFPFGWFIREQRWVHEDDTFLQPPPDASHTEAFEQTWSEACDQCHSVGASAEWLADGAPTASHVAELGIGCESCHGPAAEHAAAHRQPWTRYFSRWSGEAAAHIVNPRRLDAERATAVCAQCHGEVVRTQDHGVAFPVGQTLEPWGRIVEHGPPPYPDWLKPTLDADPTLMSSAFWDDGTMRVAGRDANAMLASACATQGELTCITCHDVHGSEANDQLRPGFRGDAACVDCHPDIAASGEVHTHHPAESEGSRCMNCHMPHTTLGLLTAMRSHRIDSPSAERTHRTGRPDACTLCHIDKPLAWSAETMNAWYGHDVPDIGGDQVSAAVDGLLRGDGAQRAVYAWHMGWGPALEAGGSDWVPGVLSQALDDPYSAVRSIAGQSLSRHGGMTALEYDYTAPPAQRQAVIREVLSTWRSPGARPRVLITDEGLDEQMVGLLQLVRDDRPVVVSE
ncbi:MAG: cytochrome c3 family protein [Myxococcota bacterium]